ncbi:flagellar hook assembly protein FlgD [Acidihalobacter ferrooxydans]|uniref:Basal-body rod modification protein FlgD n=1 Tax=Acidihalobacter ferrooxydans TaxID=1765967 RepID=A0A1P8UGN0_9GAMM|nr:flagellar hook assembly protein FlgD [Acidihalobacter ferrooxydans]APZ42985.1 hypothetical protein BW247_07665 [Acidihalobacter ferrooxydans]
MSITTNTNNSSNIYQQLGLTTASTAASGTTSGSTGASSLGESTFLKLMVTELQNQDPTSPLKSQNFLAQLAQFSAVSGIQNLQTTVSGLAGSLSKTQTLQAAGLVGRNVLVSASQADLPSQGSLNGAVDVTTPAKDVVVGIYNASGQLVRQLDLGMQSAGLASFSWDGKNAQGGSAPAGTYTLRAEGVVNGKNEALGTLTDAPVNSVTLDQKNAGVTLGLGNGLGSVDLSKVRRIS